MGRKLLIKHMKNEMQITKFTCIVREDLDPADQAVQISHAAIQFQHQHHSYAKNWHDFDNRLVFLSVKNEDELLELKAKADCLRIPYSIFNEPDQGNTYTAIALTPVMETRQLTKKLSLAKFKKK